MTKFESYPHGVFSWVDLQTNDVPGAKKFYSALFGWDFHDDPIPGMDGAFYTQFTLKGERVAGMGEQQPEMAKNGVPPAWATYVSVDDAAAIVPKVIEAGGQVIMPAAPIGDSGKIAIFIDPVGAFFGVWESGTHKGSGYANEPGSLVWNELTSRDLDTATKFYSDVFGWSFEEGPNPGYKMVCLDGTTRGGAMPFSDEMPKEIPSYWAVYFGCADVDVSVKKATDLGANVIVPKVDIEVGSFAVVQDPQGAMFSLMQLKEWPS